MKHNLELKGNGSASPVGMVLAGEQEPKSPSEKYMAALWSEVVGLEKVSLLDKFLEVGGNSLTLNIILSRIKTERGVSLEAEAFFEPERSSLSQLAKELDVLIKTT